MGYVYILTNPSFKENWIKIGRTEREVNVRSKELDNTAIPLPFEIFATIKTEKYVELEDTIHNQLTKLTDKRIRPSREFYNLAPEVALDVIKSLCNLLPDAEVNFPDEEGEEMESKPHATRVKFVKKGSYIVNYTDYFYLFNGICDAKLKVLNGNRFILLAGSIIDPGVYSHEDVIRKYRNDNAEHIRDNIVIDDIEFNSPSTPACLARGGACNGKFYWKTKDGKPLNDYIEYIK